MELRKGVGYYAFPLLLALLLVVSPAADAQVSTHVGSNGVDDKHFIIGGVEVEKNTYPWMVGLAYNIDASLVQRQFCGGSIIDDKWVLTAAHCVYDRNGNVMDVSALKVAINATNLNDPDASEILVTNIYTHPEYDHNATNPHSDIALLELATSSGIAPIALSTKSTDDLVGLQGTVIGWGAVNNDDPSRPQYPDWQHSVEVPLVSLDVCNAPASYAGAILPNQLCAGYAAGGRDSCVGDSGGPLIVTYEGVVQQAGVVSFGYGCALPNYYGIYTDIPYFIGWINQFVYVGEPEFEPELFEARAPTNSINVSSDPEAASTSLFALLLLGTGILFRRRSC